ncbi:MAG: hypothetical protein GY717_04100 [Rhodobacteraceae bacterium]|nr:hypothetical protein [Paracoccaceae bacterium]
MSGLGPGLEFDPTRQILERWELAMLMLRSTMTLALFLAAFPAWAGLRDGDVKLSQVELADYLSGQVLEFHDGSLASYHADGRFSYRYAPEADAHPGRYEVMQDSTFCTQFDSGFKRCDMIVQSGDRFVMIIANGDRYPVRSMTPME